MNDRVWVASRPRGGFGEQLLFPAADEKLGRSNSSTKISFSEARRFSNDQKRALNHQARALGLAA